MHVDPTAISRVSPVTLAVAAAFVVDVLRAFAKRAHDAVS